MKRSHGIMIFGAAGRMGQAVAERVERAEDLHISAEVFNPSGQQDNPDQYETALYESAENSDLIIDFSRHDALDKLIKVATQTSTPLVSGTTGFNEAQNLSLIQAANSIPLFYSPNMSVGVQVMCHLLEEAVGQLGFDYHIEITETHHGRKLDAPSGTAIRLRESLLSSRCAVKENLQIPIHSLRGGDVVGDHTVSFLGPGDRIEITHRATSRDTFAEGAVRAARWLLKQPAGLYGMEDLLRASNHE